MHLTLLVPELIWPEPADQFTLGKLAAPGFEWLLARATRTYHPRRPFENTLAACFGPADAPFAALRRLGEGTTEADNGHWLCADPVHLRFHQERIILADAGAFDLDEAEARSLIAALNSEFADIGQFHLGTARRWYLRLNSAVDHPVAPLSAVAGRRVDGQIQSNTLPLTRWLNEVQMFLHGHPVNEQRQNEGKPAINSLWLWGGGHLEANRASETRGQSTVFSDNPLAIGLARSSQTPHHPPPQSFADLLPIAGPQPLVVLEALLPGVLYEESEGWRQTFEKLETRWFSPLRQALGGKVQRLSLIAPTIYGELHYEINAGDRWKFWKTSRPLSTHAEELARQAHS